MSYEFKKLSDVELLEEVPEGANALIEADGVICKVPGSNLGGGNSIPTAILKEVPSGDSGADPYAVMAADAKAALPTYHATCENMTYDEVKAILTSGGSVNARLLRQDDTGSVVVFVDYPSNAAYYYWGAATDLNFVAFAFYDTIYLGDMVFYWGSNGIISTDLNEIFPQTGEVI